MQVNKRILKVKVINSFEKRNWLWSVSKNCCYCFLKFYRKDTETNIILLFWLASAIQIICTQSKHTTPCHHWVSVNFLGRRNLTKKEKNMTKINIPVLQSWSRFKTGFFIFSVIFIEILSLFRYYHSWGGNTSI